MNPSSIDNHISVNPPASPIMPASVNTPASASVSSSANRPSTANSGFSATNRPSAANGSSPLTLPDLNRRLCQLCRQNHLTTYQLAKQSGVSYSVLSSMFRRGTNPSFTTLCRLCYGMNISLSQFFSENDLAIIPLDDNAKKLVNLYTRLSTSGKELLMAYLQGLCDNEIAGLVSLHNNISD